MRPRLEAPALLVSLAAPYKVPLLIVLVAMSVETVTSLAAPWPLKVVIDHLSGAAPASDWPWVSALAASGILLIALVSGVASYVDNYYTESVGQHVANDLRMRVYDHLECLSFSYYDTHETGVLLSTLTEDVATVQNFISTSTLSILIDVLSIVGMLGLMLWLNWRVTLFVSIVGPVVLFFVARFRRAVKTATREMRRRESEIVSVIQTGLQSIRTVQAFGGRSVELGRLRTASYATIDAALSARRVKSLLSPSIDVVVAGCTGLVLWQGAAATVAGAMTLGSLVVFLTYLGKFFKPLQELAKMTSAIAQTNVAIERVEDILHVEMSVQERPGAREPAAVRGAIAFEHVAFSYSPRATLLRDIHFVIEAGQFVGIVGQTGSGKSTIASLIPRFYDASGGRIMLDGVDVRDLTLRGLRRQIGFVLQDTALFRGTIRDNIAYGRHHATDDEIVEAARNANAHDFITKMSGGYDTPVGERGVTLSGGQRQRIGMARAFIRNPPILILDEPTSSLDAEAERLVFEGMERLAQGRTVIMVAHRLNTLRAADAILVVDGGRIAERGRHDDLVAADGLYARLYAAQTAGRLAWHGH